MEMEIERHPFFDIPTIQSEDDLDPTRYHDPSEIDLALGGHNMAHAMPMGPKGMRGVIVKKSTMQGAPLGHNADGVATRVIVDPDVPGGGFVVDPTQIRKELMAQAVRATGVDRPQTLEDLRMRASATYRAFAIDDAPLPQPATPEIRQAPVNLPGLYVVPSATELGGQRPMEHYEQPQSPQIQTTEIGQTAEPVKRGASAAEQQLADMQGGGMPQPAAIPGIGQQMMGQAPPPEPSGQMIPPIGGNAPLQAPNNMQPQQVPMGAPTYQQAYPQPQPQPQPQSPATTLFGGQQQQQSLLPAGNGQHPQVQQSLFGKQIRAEASVGPPTFKVRFEVQGSPFSQECFFHDVVVQQQVLVLVFDKRAKGFPCTFPQPVEQDMAVHIENTPVVFLTQVPGVQYPFLEWEHCVLFIKERFPYPDESQQAPPPQQAPMPMPMSPAQMAAPGQFGM